LTATAKRAKLQHEVFPSTDAGDAHAGPSEDMAAQHEGAVGERAPRRSGRQRTPSRRLADAVADAAGRQHGALIAPKRTADGQPPSADEGRPKKSRRFHSAATPLHPRGEYPSNPAASTLHSFRWRQSAPGPKHAWQKASYPSSQIREHYLCAVGAAWTQAAPSHVATAARTVRRSRRRQSRRKTSAAPAPAPGQPAAPSPIARPRATPLPSASLPPPQHAELTVGNPVSPAQMDGLPFDRGRVSTLRR